MSVVTPFRALRPGRQFAQAVASPPYDVVTLEEATAIVRANPLSFLRVEKSEIDVGDGGEETAIYQTAKANLDRLVQEGVLHQDGKACFYLYRQKTGSHEQTGLAAGISIAEYESGLIRKHEQTRADKEADRIRHVLAVNAQTGPVFVTYFGRPAIDSLVARIAAGLPEYDFAAEDGVAHTVWVIDDPKDIFEIVDEFSKVDRLYIADGHHRAAAAAAVGTMKRKGNPRPRGEAPSERMMAVLFPSDQIRIMAYNRVVRDLAGLDENEFLRRVGSTFDIAADPAGKSPAGLHEFGMYLRGLWYALKAKEGLYDRQDLVHTLDVSILQDHLLGPVLGIEDPRTNGRIDFVGGVKGTMYLEGLVDSKAYDVAFSLFPTTLQQLIDIADAGKVMPPKSTWFEPKLRSGLFIHSLDS
ncbi:MAG: DUF1015 domain-containing protein [Deltaproteobacteria bacterium]|nr:DUF1015 domain-containing protein [Deltaproteobacteria bacterium]